MTSYIKALVSSNRRRLKTDSIDGTKKFDLDLTYIVKDRIIAMGWPGRGSETIYRNDINTVKEFLDMEHRNHYMVFNLAEKSYPHSYFHNRVMHVPFPDHQPAPLNVLLFIISNARNYLLENTSNVVVIHCKAGKGRTGMVIACLLIQLGIIQNIKEKTVNDLCREALEFFGNMRSSKGIGVQCPSQLRFVKYYCKLIKKNNMMTSNMKGKNEITDDDDNNNNNNDNNKKVSESGIRNERRKQKVMPPLVENIANENNKINLKSIVLHQIPDYNNDGGFQPTLIIFQARGADYKGDVLFNSAWKTYGNGKNQKYFAVEGRRQQISIPVDLTVSGDLHIRVYHKDRITIRLNINTYFLQNTEDKELDVNNVNNFWEGIGPIIRRNKPNRNNNNDNNDNNDKDTTTDNNNNNNNKNADEIYKFRLKKYEIDKASKSDRYNEDFTLELNYTLMKNSGNNENDGKTLEERQRLNDPNNALIMKQYALNSKPKYGFLYKQSGAFIKTWKERWFVLHNGILSYYDKKDSVAPRHQFILADFNGDALGTLYIKLVPLQEWEETLKPVVLKCHSEDEMMSWLNAILKHSVLAQTKTKFKEGI